MIRTFSLAGVVALALVISAAAEQQAPLFAPGTPVVVVGPITSPPKGALNEKKMQVAIGPERTDHTLHFRKAAVFGLRGQKIDEDGLDDGMWVRAEGRVMKDPRRIEVARVHVIAPDASGHKRGAFYRSGFDSGYVVSVAGTRQVFPAVNVPDTFAPFTLVGRISDDTGSFSKTRKLQLKSQGFEWTVRVPKEAAVLDLAGKPISVHEVHRGQWVRAYGWRTGDLRMRVERLENIGADEAFRTSQLYRSEFPLGYVDVVEGPDRILTTKLSGTVIGIDRDSGLLTVRDADGKDHAIFTDTAVFMRDGQPLMFDTIQRGDVVSVEVRSFHFKP